MFPVSLDCPFVIGPSVFSNIYLQMTKEKCQKYLPVSSIRKFDREDSSFECFNRATHNYGLRLPFSFLSGNIFKLSLTVKLDKPAM
jgi:hypothetical protein